MSRIVVDAELRNRLLNLMEPLEFCDESGRVLGRFLPAGDPSEHPPSGPEVGDEELERRAKSDKWYTTDEVLAHLEKL
jgi:hypothetical protein